MITAFVIVCGLAVFEAFLLFCVAVYAGMLKGDIKDATTPVEPVESVRGEWEDTEE